MRHSSGAQPKCQASTEQSHSDLRSWSTITRITQHTITTSRQQKSSTLHIIYLSYVIKCHPHKKRFYPNHFIKEFNIVSYMVYKKKIKMITYGWFSSASERFPTRLCHHSQWIINLMSSWCPCLFPHHLQYIHNH